MIDCTGNREAAFEQAGWSSGMWWRGGADWTIRLARTARLRGGSLPMVVGVELHLVALRRRRHR
jgi:hypothetical protein